MPETMIDSARCPACDHVGMEYRAETIDLPYLGESLETMMRCSACGYRHTDFVLTGIKDPTRWSYRVDSEADMSVRVVRSSSGTVRIPELGIDIEPGVASDAYITNVEGIIVRVEAILAQLKRDSEDHETTTRIAEMEQTFLAMRDGRAEPVTLVIEDPFGNSSILHEDADSELIPEDEAAKLKVGAFVFDQTNADAEEE